MVFNSISVQSVIYTLYIAPNLSHAKAKKMCESLLASQLEGLLVETGSSMTLVVPS